MDLDGLTDGRRAMISAFGAVSTLALRAGADEDAVSEQQATFFDGNEAVKRALAGESRPVRAQEGTSR